MTFIFFCMRLENNIFHLRMDLDPMQYLGYCTRCNYTNLLSHRFLPSYFLTLTFKHFFMTFLIQWLRLKVKNSNFNLSYPMLLHQVQYSSDLNPLKCVALLDHLFSVHLPFPSYRITCKVVKFKILCRIVGSK